VEEQGQTVLLITQEEVAAPVLLVQHLVLLVELVVLV
jgi:hypothetical protein